MWQLIKKCHNYLPEIVDAKAPEKRDFRSIILLAKVSMEREKLDTSEDEEDGSGKMSKFDSRILIADYRCITRVDCNYCIYVSG